MSDITWSNYQRWPTELEELLGVITSDTITVRLNTSTVPMGPSDAYGSYVEPPSSSGYAPVDATPWTISADSTGATATLTAAAWALEPVGSTSITLTGWSLQDDTLEVIIQAGTISPPFTFEGFRSVSVSPITLTLAACGTSPPPPPPPGPAWSLLTSAFVASTGSSPITTAPIDTTGADLIIIFMMQMYSGSPIVVVSDSENNTWSSLSPYRDFGGSQNGACCIGYTSSPATSASHTFIGTFPGSFGGINPAIAVMAFKGSGSRQADQQNGSAAFAGTTTQPGSITPRDNNSLVVSCISTGSNIASVSVNDGFAIPSGMSYEGGVDAPSCAAAYLIQSTAVGINPTWSYSNTTFSGTAAIASFFGN